MSAIYTSYSDYTTRFGKQTRDYTLLKDNIVDFVDETMEKLILNPTSSEIAFREMHLFNDIAEQVFFLIRGRFYFLDFFIPRLHLAIEIDGGYHNKKDSKKHDRLRDEDFCSIGIMTVRVTNAELKRKDFPLLLKCRCLEPFDRYQYRILRDSVTMKRRGILKRNAKKHPSTILFHGKAVDFAKL